MKSAQSLVVNFVIFRREVELQSFYSAILIPSPTILLYIEADQAAEQCERLLEHLKRVIVEEIILR